MGALRGDTCSAVAARYSPRPQRPRWDELIDELASRSVREGLLLTHVRRLRCSGVSVASCVGLDVGCWVERLVTTSHEPVKRSSLPSSLWRQTSPRYS